MQFSQDSNGLGLDERVGVLDQNMDRRYVLKGLGTGMIAGLMFAPSVAEAQRPANLVGSKNSLDKQVNMFAKDNLSMLYDRDLLPDSQMRTSRRLVEVKANRHYTLEGEGNGRTLTRPYVSLFLQNFANDFYKKFGTPLKYTSLTRSHEYQTELRKKNKNATLPEKSPHVRGAALDASYVPMNEKRKAWVRKYLGDLDRLGVIEATEEKVQRTFHVMVFKSYAGHSQQNTGMTDAQFATYFERRTGGRMY